MLQLSPEKTLPYQVSLEAKKLGLVSAIFTPMTGTREETVKTAKALETANAIKTAGIGRDGMSKGEYLKNLVQVLCLRYPINCEKKSVLALFDLGSEINMVYPAFAKELGLPIGPTDVGVQKIDGILLNTYEMVIAAFLVKDKANRVRFFEETFLVANVSPEIVLEMLFLILSYANVDFLGRKLWWRTYTTKKALPTIRCVELVGKKEFAATALDLEHETYVVYVGSVSSDALPSSSPLNIHLFCRPQIFGLLPKRLLQRSPPSIWTSRMFFLQTWRPSSSSIPRSTITL